MGRYRSGQTGQTVNLLATPSQVRILSCPPLKLSFILIYTMKKFLPLVILTSFLAIGCSHDNEEEVIVDSFEEPEITETEETLNFTLDHPSDWINTSSSTENELVKFNIVKEIDPTTILSINVTEEDTFGMVGESYYAANIETLKSMIPTVEIISEDTLTLESGDFVFRTVYSAELYDLDFQFLVYTATDVVSEKGLYWLLRRRILKEAKPL